MICPNCGSNNPDGTAFCANCGSPVSNGAPNNGAIPPQAQPNFQGSAPNGGMTPPPVFNGNPFPGGHIEQRNIALCIILSIITCGIYGLYWIYKLTEDVNTLKGDPNATSGGVVILLGIITCGIYMWYWLYKQGDNLDQIKGIPWTACRKQRHSVSDPGDRRTEHRFLCTDAERAEPAGIIQNKS